MLNIKTRGKKTPEKLDNNMLVATSRPLMKKMFHYSRKVETKKEKYVQK